MANPPYNCHETDYIRKNKSALKSLFPEVGVLNMYSMFIAALVDCAKPNSLIGLITLDSFLTAKGHGPLRRLILRECSIHKIILCPTDLFLDQGADVRTCILILQKGHNNQASIDTANRPFSLEAFRSVLEGQEFKAVELNELVLSGSSDNKEMIIGVPREIKEMFDWRRLGSVFKCITGISTGNDKKYLSNKKGGEHIVPFYKNPASRRFHTTPDAYLPDNFLKIGDEVDNFIVRNKKYLYKEGITCSSMGVIFAAAYLPRKSTFGVNATIIPPATDLWWLLSYLNSSLVTYFVRGVLCRSNMITAGYVSRIPIPTLDEKTKQALGDLSKQAYKARSGKEKAEALVVSIDNILRKSVGWSEDTQKAIMSFRSHLLKAT